jgi:hypothetical protein
MAAAMLILLAAMRIPSIKSILRPEAIVLGSHLQKLLKQWAEINTHDRSPSVQWAIRLIETADRLIKDQVVDSPLTDGMQRSWNGIG